MFTEEQFSGTYKNKNIDIVSVFEAVGKNANGIIDDNELYNIEKKLLGAWILWWHVYCKYNGMRNRSYGFVITNSSAQTAISKSTNDTKEASKTL